MEFQTKTKPSPLNRKLAHSFSHKRMFVNNSYAMTWKQIRSEWERQAKHNGVTPTDKPVKIEIAFGWKRMDVDSCVKPILDELEGIAYVNDKQVVSVLVYRVPEAEIRIKIFPQL